MLSVQTASVVFKVQKDVIQWQHLIVPTATILQRKIYQEPAICLT